MLTKRELLDGLSRSPRWGRFLAARNDAGKGVQRANEGQSGKVAAGGQLSL